jgi:hypothetical protein
MFTPEQRETVLEALGFANQAKSGGLYRRGLSYAKQGALNVFYHFNLKAALSGLNLAFVFFYCREILPLVGAIFASASLGTAVACFYKHKEEALQAARIAPYPAVQNDV